MQRQTQPVVIGWTCHNSHFNVDQRPLRSDISANRDNITQAEESAIEARSARFQIGMSIPTVAHGFPHRLL